MNRLYLYISSLFVLVIAVFYSSATKKRREALAVEQMSKKLRAQAHFVIDEPVDRGPASLGSSASPLGPRDRWISALFPKKDSDKSAMSSLKSQLLREKSRERRIALEELRRSGSRVGDDGIAVLSKLRAIPRSRIEDEASLEERATVLDPNWAIFERSEMPAGNPVVYDFHKDRWGVMTGMIEVSASNAATLGDMRNGLESQGYQVIKPPTSQDTLYVFSGSKSLDKINQVSEELKNRFGSKSVKAETIFVWRSAQ